MMQTATQQRLLLLVFLLFPIIINSVTADKSTTNGHSSDLVLDFVSTSKDIIPADNNTSRNHHDTDSLLEVEDEAKQQQQQQQQLLLGQNQEAQIVPQNNIAFSRNIQQLEQQQTQSSTNSTTIINDNKSNLTTAEVPSEENDDNDYCSSCSSGEEDSDEESILLSSCCEIGYCGYCDPIENRVKCVRHRSQPNKEHLWDATTEEFLSSGYFCEFCIYPIFHMCTDGGEFVAGTLQQICDASNRNRNIFCPLGKRGKVGCSGTERGWEEPCVYPECSLRQLYGNTKPWLFVVGIFLTAIAWAFNYIIILYLNYKREGWNVDRLSNFNRFQLVVKCLIDLSIVNILVLSITARNADDRFKCDGSSYYSQLLYAAAVYSVDIFTDANAIYWGSKVRIHADDYDSAKFEGLERLWGVTTLIPSIVYTTAALSWYHTWLHTIQIVDDDSQLAWLHVATYIVWLGPIIEVLSEYCYIKRHAPELLENGGTCFLSYLNYRNLESTPKYGPQWGGAICASSSLSMMIYTTAEAIATFVLDDKWSFARFVVLLVLELLLFLVEKIYHGDNDDENTTSDDICLDVAPTAAGNTAKEEEEGQPNEAPTNDSKEEEDHQQDEASTSDSNDQSLHVEIQIDHGSNHIISVPAHSPNESENTYHPSMTEGGNVNPKKDEETGDCGREGDQQNVATDHTPGTVKSLLYQRKGEDRQEIVKPTLSPRGQA